MQANVAVGVGNTPYPAVGHGDEKVAFFLFRLETGHRGPLRRTITPDVVVGWGHAEDSHCVIVLDAKYRIEDGLTEALNSIYTYRVPWFTARRRVPSNVSWRPPICSRRIFRKRTVRPCTKIWRLRAGILTVDTASRSASPSSRCGPACKQRSRVACSERSSLRHAERTVDASGLRPWWVLDGAEISRHVFERPFGRDVARFAQLREQRMIYRLALGQPNQEDFIKVLSRSGESTRSMLQPLVLDLSAMGLKQTSNVTCAAKARGHGFALPASTR